MKSTHILAIVIAAGFPGAALFAQGEHGNTGGMMKQDPAQMAEMHQKMEAEMKAQNAELDKLVADMNAATGDKKVDAIAAVVSKMVEQRKAMHEKMGAMHGDMAAECCREGMPKHGMMKGKAGSSATPGTE